MNHKCQRCGDKSRDGNPSAPLTGYNASWEPLVVKAGKCSREFWLCRTCMEVVVTIIDRVATRPETPIGPS